MKITRKTILSLFLLTGIFLTINFVSAGLCKSSTGYYEDCYSYSYYNYGDYDYDYYNYYPPHQPLLPHPFPQPSTHYHYVSAYNEGYYDGYNYGYYSGKHDYPKYYYYNANKEYPSKYYIHKWRY